MTIHTQKVVYTGLYLPAPQSMLQVHPYIAHNLHRRRKWAPMSSINGVARAAEIFLSRVFPSNLDMSTLKSPSTISDSPWGSYLTAIMMISMVKAPSGVM